MDSELVCWKCGASLDEVPLPLARLSECLACGAELHVCRLCEFYDLKVAKHCREPIAEGIKEKERANFCDYFHPRPNAYVAMDESEVDKTKEGLAALFAGNGGDIGDSPASMEDKDTQRLEDLFKNRD
ncbi:MAG: hypothetical protein V3R51_04315 [Gammaproteobacteria bacterium]